MLQEEITLTVQDEEQAQIQAAFEQLMHAFKTPLSPADEQIMHDAFDLARNAHSEQRRKSGEPYIFHPIKVARICVEELGLGPTAAACALMHDVVEDTSIKLHAIRELFGDRVARIVEGLTKLDEMKDKESPQAENISKVLKAMLFDVRVVLIKMADRLHNLRTIGSMTPSKQLKIAAETSTIYAPLAHRLGLNTVKTEFQDICLKISHPDEYHDIAEQLAQTKRARKAYIDAFTEPLQKALKELDIEARITGRPKSIYSIWNKIRTKNVPFEDIYDLFAIRIIVKTPPGAEERLLCWHIYMIVTDQYKPIPERLKDWVTNPKANGYESLHTTVIGPEGRYVEVQIRSERMDEIAERGFAAHWKYKGAMTLSNRANTFDNWLAQVRETLETSDSASAVEFLADFQSELFAEGVHVFTPQGDMKVLPDGATALDFAFNIHSDVGCTCQAVKVNNRLVPIGYLLQNGDQVQVITNKNQKPSEDWLKIVKSSKAKTRIRVALKEEKRKQAELGKEILERKLKGYRVGVEENVDMLAKHFGYPNRLEFLSAISLEQVDFTGLKRFKADGNKLALIEVPRPAETSESIAISPDAPAKSRAKTVDRTPQIIINDESGMYHAYTFATCCNPVQGDPIFAYLTTNQGVKIHRATCPNADYLLANFSYRVLKAGWGNTVKSEFLANLLVTGIDIGPGVINQLTNCISALGLNIRSFSISADGGYFEGKIALIVSNTDQLHRTMLVLKGFEWVSNVLRVE